MRVIHRSFIVMILGARWGSRPYMIFFAGLFSTRLILGYQHPPSNANTLHLPARPAVYAADLVTCLLPSAHPQKVPVGVINARDELQLLSRYFHFSNCTISAKCVFQIDSRKAIQALRCMFLNTDLSHIHWWCYCSFYRTNALRVGSRTSI